MMPAISRTRSLWLWLPLLLWGCTTVPSTPASNTFQFVYTSDAHYGLTRPTFQGGRNIDAHSVNAAMVAQINGLPQLPIPCDGGIHGCQPVGAIDFLVETGDIANRMEEAAQSAADSWNQFASDYLQALSIQDAQGQPSRVFLAVGNHDVTNAIGFYRPMQPKQDASVLAAIYNRMLKPAQAKTPASYNYATDKVHYSQDWQGVHLVFVNMWPDRGERAWLEQDLQKVPAEQPVVIFAHDPPSVDAKHFINPNGTHNINAQDKFENLLTDPLADIDAQGKASVGAKTTIEQRDWARFLKAHRNIVAYFHGHDNYNQFYVWQGPDQDVQLNTFRVDSPMKGEASSKDESKLSFQLVSVDPQAQQMTVREYRWNTDTSKAWGEMRTVSLRPH